MIRQFAQRLTEFIGNPEDLQVRLFPTDDDPKPQAVLLYLSSITDETKINALWTQPIVDEWLTQGTVPDFAKIAAAQGISVNGRAVDPKVPTVARQLFEAKCVLLANGSGKAVAIDVPQWNNRSVTAPEIEHSIIGPRDAFVEDIQINLSMIRRRIRHEDLRVETFTVGVKSQTKTNLVYMGGLVNRQVLDRIKERIQAIELDVLLDVTQLGQNYSVLLLVTLIPLAISRPISTVIDGVGRNSVWYVIPAALLALAGASISLQISKRCGGVSLISAYGDITFRWLRPVFSFLHGILFAAIAAYSIGLSGNFSSQALQYGDARSAMLFEAIIATGAALFPMETMIRFAQLILILAGPLLLLVVLPMLINAQWSWLLPMFDTVAMIHPAPAFAALMCIFSPIAAVALISRDKTRVTVPSLGASIGIAALYLSYLTAMSIATFGIHTAQTIVYLLFNTQGAVTIERLPFQRLVSINSLIFVFLKVVSNAFLLRSAALCLVRMLGIRLGGIPIALAGGIVAAVLWKIDLPFFFRHTPVWLGYYSFLMIVLLPAFMYAILLLRRKPG